MKVEDQTADVVDVEEEEVADEVVTKVDMVIAIMVDNKAIMMEDMEEANNLMVVVIKAMATRGDMVGNLLDIIKVAMVVVTAMVVVQEDTTNSNNRHTQHRILTNNKIMEEVTTTTAVVVAQTVVMELLHEEDLEVVVLLQQITDMRPIKV